jgi:RHH-type proline utilization regulon transcriptional repressor/proline dehydrogenase/delta 1-pyrroline-5-carboxylate dehydrogenase
MDTLVVEDAPATTDPAGGAASAAPFAAFRAGLRPQTPLRAAITAAHRRPEPECLPPLLDLAELPPEAAAEAARTARALVERLRGRTRSGGGVEGLIHEYSLSSQEGVALMCLAEALLRVPDTATRDALIRDKIGGGDWRAHLGQSPSLFVNAATWGLVVTGKLTATNSETGLSGALTRLIARGGEPVIRRGVDMAMRLMGEQFVTGQTIEEALANSRRMGCEGLPPLLRHAGRGGPPRPPTPERTSAITRVPSTPSAGAAGGRGVSRSAPAFPGQALGAATRAIPAPQAERVAERGAAARAVAGPCCTALVHRPQHRRRREPTGSTLRSTSWNRSASRRS